MNLCTHFALIGVLLTTAAASATSFQDTIIAAQTKLEESKKELEQNLTDFISRGGSATSFTPTDCEAKPSIKDNYLILGTRGSCIVHVEKNGNSANIEYTEWFMPKHNGLYEKKPFGSNNVLAYFQIHPKFDSLGNRVSCTVHFSKYSDSYHESEHALCGNNLNTGGSVGCLFLQDQFSLPDDFSVVGCE